MRAVLVTLVLMALPVSAETASPSFDCSRAQGKAQQLVCSDPLLADLDREVSRLYALAAKSPQLDTKQRARLRAMQVGWIRGRDDCWKADDLRACVLDNYGMRIHELRRDYPQARADAPGGLSRGPFALTCPDAAAPLAVTFIGTDPALAVLEAQGTFHTLTQTRTASGARYAAGAGAGEISIWNKGDSARVTLPETPAMNCSIAAME